MGRHLSTYLESSGQLRMDSFQVEALRNCIDDDLIAKEKRLAAILSDVHIDLPQYEQLRLNARECLHNVHFVLQEREARRRLLKEVVRRVLTISTSHMPSDLPAWGDRVVMSYGSGWVVFAHPAGASDTPKWLKGIDQLAEQHDCALIRFECDATVTPDLAVYEWAETAYNPIAGAIPPLDIEHGDPLSYVTAHLHKLDRSTLIDALTDIIARTGFDENNLRDEHEPVSGADFLDSVKLTVKTQLKLTL